MVELTRRIRHGRDLGRAGRRLDQLLGVCAMVPILACGLASWIVSSRSASALTLVALVWTGGLLAFFAGVRRGLSFSEQGGATIGEIAGLLWLFALAVTVILLRSCGLAMIGLVSVMALDVIAARRRQAPGYFAGFRLVQLCAGLVGLVLLLIRGA